jgi:hypothetical protein
MARWRNRLLLVEMESSYGVSGSPNGSDALTVSELDVTPLEIELLDRELITGNFGNTEKVVGSSMSRLSFPVEFAGSGAAGTAPRHGKLLRACGFDETITAAAVTGTAQAGAAGSITLASGASAVNSYYNGMIITITAGTGNGQVGVITGYVGSTKVATVVARTSAGFTASTDSEYSIGANVKYTLVDTDQESVTMSFYADGSHHLATGARGTVGLNLAHKEIPRLSFEFTALYNAAAAQANPSAVFGDQAAPVAVNHANTKPAIVHGYQACLESLEMSMSNEVIHRQLAGCSEQVEITDWAPEGTAVIEAPALGTKDYFAAAASQATGLILAVHGTAAGNICTIGMPKCNLGSPTYSDSDGVLMLNLPFMPNPVVRNDEVYFVFS